MENEILGIIANFYNVTVDSLVISSSRKREEVRRRQVTAYILKNYTSLSLKRIGQIIAGCDHSTIIHSVEVIKDQMFIYPSLKKEVRKVESIIKNELQLQPINY